MAGKVGIGSAPGDTNSDEDAVLNFKNTDTSIGTHGHASDVAAQFRYDSSEDSLLLLKKTQAVSGQSSEIMKVDRNGLVTFNTNVSFQGGSSTINSTTTSIEDQQVEIGLSES